MGATVGIASAGGDDAFALREHGGIVSSLAVLPVSEALQNLMEELDAAEAAAEAAAAAALAGDDEEEEESEGGSDDGGGDDDDDATAEEEPPPDDDAPMRFEQLLVSASWDRTVRVWDVTKLRCLKTLAGHSDSVTCVDVLHSLLPGEDARVATGSLDHDVKVWSVASQSCAFTLEGHSDAVSCILPVAGTSLLASGAWDGTLKVWDVGGDEQPQSSRLLFTVAAAGGGEKISCLAAIEDAPDGAHRVAVGSWDGGIRVINLSSRAVVGTMLGHESWVNCLSSAGDLLHDGSEILASGGLDCTLRLWDLLSRSCLVCLRGHSASISFIRAFVCGKTQMILTGSLDRTMRIWDPVEHACRVVLSDHRGDVCSGALLDNVPSPFREGGLFLTSGSADATIRGYDLAALTRPFDPDAVPFVPAVKAPPKKAASAEGSEEDHDGEGGEEGSGGGGGGSTEEQDEEKEVMDGAAWVGEFKF